MQAGEDASQLKIKYTQLQLEVLISSKYSFVMIKPELLYIYCFHGFDLLSMMKLLKRVFLRSFFNFPLGGTVMLVKLY